MILGLALILALGAISIGMTRASDPRDDGADRNDAEIRAMEALIRAEAARQGVPAHVALATAWVESRMRPRAEGDLRWHTNAKRYAKVVPANSPFRHQPQLWHSYGLFQLLAPYHVRPNEDPRVLLDVRTNIERGVAHLKDLLRVSKDLDELRLRYVGGTQLAPAKRAPILHDWRNALQRYLVQEHLA